VLRAETVKDGMRLFLSGGEIIEADWVFVAKGIVPKEDKALPALAR